MSHVYLVNNEILCIWTHFCLNCSTDIYQYSVNALIEMKSLFFEIVRAKFILQSELVIREPTRIIQCNLRDVSTLRSLVVIKNASDKFVISFFHPSIATVSKVKHVHTVGLLSRKKRAFNFPLSYLASLLLPLPWRHLPLRRGSMSASCYPDGV